MSLERLFRPRSVAVIGGGAAEQVVLQCAKMGFAGDVWPVHPTRDTMAGRRCYRSVADLPEAPDAAFIGVNRHLTVEIVGELARRGAGGAICYASGFGETADGAALNAALLAAAGDMPVLGPNCYGFINYLDGALLWPDQHGGARTAQGVVIVAQSSNIAMNVTMQRRGLPIAYVATAGNQAQTGLCKIAHAFLEDERVTALGLHVEGIDDVRRFEAMARRARELGKPIVALTVGRSEQARAATVSHTASVSGSAAGSAAFYDRLGIARLRSVPEFLEALKLLHVHGPLPGGDLLSMSCSGGEASVMADAAVGRSVRFRPFEADEQARVWATLSEMVTVSNPLDYHTFVWAREQPMTATFAAAIGCGFDLSMLVLDFPRADRCGDGDWDIASRALVAAREATGARLAVVATMAENMPEARAIELIDAGIAPLCGIDEALAAAEAAAFIGRNWARPVTADLLVLENGEGTEAAILSEAAAKAELAAFGLPIPPGRVVASVEDALAAGDAVGFPVAIKVLGVAHKSELGAVRLNVVRADLPRVLAEMPSASRRWLVEAMVTDAVAELLVGVVREPPYGLLMTIAAGGVLAELLQDSRSLLLPATDDDIRDAILTLKTAPLLQGFRGRPPADLEAAVAAAAAVARYAEANAATLEELDVNPLLVLPRGKGAVAVDALIRMRTI